MKCAAGQADQLYGNSAENGNSVFRAIANNPQAYGQRFLKTVASLPRLMHDAYGKRTFYPLLFLAALGIFTLIRAKKYSIFLLCLAWSGYLGIYFLTFFRAGYLRTPFFIVLLLAGFGIQELIEALGEKRQWIWVAILLALTGIGLWLSLNYFYFSTIVLLACMLLGYWLKQSNLGITNTPELVLMLFLAAGLILRGGFTPPVIPTLGENAEEQAVVALEKELPENSLVAAGTPGIVWEARMAYVPSINKDFIADSAEQYYTILKKAGVKAIYVDNTITNNSALWDLIRSGIGLYYEKIYSGRAGSILVLLLK
jgi:hypothetical protein